MNITIIEPKLRVRVKSSANGRFMVMVERTTNNGKVFRISNNLHSAVEAIRYVAAIKAAADC